MASRDKYGNLDDILKPAETDVAVAPRRRRPSPALGAMQGDRPVSLTERLKTEKQAAEQALVETRETFAKEKADLLKRLERSASEGGADSPISFVMPVTKQRVDFQLLELDPDLIDVSTENERIQDYLDEISLRDILPSIKKHGQQKPGTVRPSAEGRYELIEGSRRLAAVKLSGQPYLALVGDVPDADVRELSVIENKQQDVSPYEKAVAYQKRIEHGEFDNWTQLGAAMGISSSHISRFRACVELDDLFVRILPSPSDMPLSYGETVAQLRKKGELALLSKAEELLKIRQAFLGDEDELFSVEDIIKLLKSAVRAKINTPTIKKPVSYRSKDGAVVLKHTISRRTGSNKFELVGVPEDKLEQIRDYLVKSLGVIVK
jgi:ParB family chromosome partitioning protein